MKLQNAYTDAPKLHENLLLGSLQLFFWLFFHPSAWGNHLARIDPTLSPHFTLAELSLAQWRQPALRRLLLMILIIWPFLLALSVGLTLWVLNVSFGLWPFNFAEGALTSIAMVVVCSVIISLLMGTMLALETAPIGGVLFSFGASIATMFVEIELSTVAGFSGFLLFFPEADEWLQVTLLGTTIRFSLKFFLLGLAISLGVGLFGSFVSRLADQKGEQEEKKTSGGLPFWIGLLSGKQIVLAFLIGFFFAVVAVFFALRLLWGGDVQANVSLPTLGVIVGFITLFGLITGWRIGDWLHGMKLVLGISSLFGATFLLAVSGSGPLATGISFGIFIGALASFLFILPYIFIEPYTGPRGAAIITAVIIGTAAPAPYMEFIDPWIIILPFSFVATLLGLTWTRWLPVLLYPFETLWNRLLYWKDQQHEENHALRWHSAFWDEQQYLPLRGLDSYLLFVTERNPAGGQAAIEYLSTSRQRWAAQAAQIELDARLLSRCEDVEAISQVSGGLAAGELEGPASALLRSFSRISQDVYVARQQTSSERTRLALRAVEGHLDRLLRELTSSSEPYTVRFHPIAAHWHQIVVDAAESMAQMTERKQEIDNPYIFSVPLSADEKIFVGRSDIIARLSEHLLHSHPPPLFLYGQRRMGKTSLLENLAHLLPKKIVPLFVDGERVSDASDAPDFYYNIAKQMMKSAQRQRSLILPNFRREHLTSQPFMRFNEWLDEVEQAICTTEEQVIVLMLDEFHYMNRVFSKEPFDESELLRLLRHLISQHPRFKLLLSSSHALSEFESWATPLIHLQLIKMSYLTEEEARQLIEQPIKNFPLHYEPDATEHIYKLTRGYPHLVQLLCSEMVELKNAQPSTTRRLACKADVDAAIPLALASGSFFFTDIERNQVDQNGIALLRYLARKGEGAIIKRDALTREIAHDCDDTLKLLLQRDLIEAVEDGYRFQVELIRRWFAQK